jgi:hypothetical protein
MSLSENIKGLANDIVQLNELKIGLANDIVQLNELKIEALKQTLPTKEQTLQMLDDARKQEKPSHLSDEQWNKWLETGKKIKENFKLSY